MHDATKPAPTAGGIEWTTTNAGDGFITFRYGTGAVTRVRVFCASAQYEDWQFAHDVAQAIYCLPLLVNACDKARRRMGDDDCRETEIDFAFDSAMNWYGTTESACGVQE